jgi:hypothetical protein
MLRESVASGNDAGEKNMYRMFMNNESTRQQSKNGWNIWLLGLLLKDTKGLIIFLLHTYFLYEFKCESKKARKEGRGGGRVL